MSYFSVPANPNHDYDWKGQYTGVTELQNVTPDLSPDLNAPPLGREHPKKSRTWLIVSVFFALAWLCPIGILLVLNGRSYVIGASVGCGFTHNCDFDPFAADSFGQARKLDKRDHNILGGLQFVAKALEVWFITIAACLVYDLTMMLATNRHGLPIGYLMTHVEFSDLKSLFERAFWISAHPLKHHNGRPGQRSTWLFVFVVFVVFLCILSNLMGPATAILVLPGLGWKDVRVPNNLRFGEIESAGTPEYCDSAGDYTCYYSTNLDDFSSAVIAGWNETHSHFPKYPGLLTPVVSQQAAVSFAFNVSGATGAFWVPNRHVLSDVSSDFLQYGIVKDDNSLSEAENDTATTIDKHYYKSSRNSLEAQLRRQGPSIGVLGGCLRGGATVVPISDDMSVLCYSYDGTFPEHPVKCIRAGAGWQDSGNSHSRFYIGDNASETDENIEVDVYSTNRVVYLPSTSLPCSSSSGGDQACWNKLFTANVQDDMYNVSFSQQIIQYSLPSSGQPTLSMWCGNLAYLGLPDYTMDPDPRTNPLGIVGMDHLPDPDSEDFDLTSSLAIHPDWILAAWSTTTSGTVNAERTAAKNLVSAMKSAVYSNQPLFDNGTYDAAGDKNLNLFMLQHLFSVGQAMSMVTYTATNTKDLSTKDEDHPLLQVALSVYVWAYGLETRTSKMGFTVAGVGCLIVLFRIFICLKTRNRQRSPTEIIAAALEHEHRGELGGLNHEKEVAKVRFHVHADPTGKVKFVPR